MVGFQRLCPQAAHWLAFNALWVSDAGLLYFPVVQEWEGGGTHRWIEIPWREKSAADYKEPAPGVKLFPNHRDRRSASRPSAK
ncbi:DUF1775 domain-containing protein [Bradyrhizobium sp. 193]|uniref:DUF1775 domain-containing protein n=1 Tax=Bradyrhizobium sp. 193 TaxID=2782661 RepID=UPI001FFA1FB3|nr:DUF1775 domain-containing protein [Bradyrhizobium sp. 193]MCK1483378.1 DUF1775 domain-containing protein [Bradyrhizobium sp. 193]